MNKGKDYNVDKREVQSLIKQIAGTNGFVPIRFIECVVVSVDEESMTCICDSIGDNSNIEDLTVRFNTNVTDGEVSVPLVDSQVLVGYSDYITPFVVSFTDLLKWSMFIGNQGFVINEDSQIFNDGKYGGIPIVKSEYIGESEKGLLTKINNLENLVNTILQTLISTTIPLAPSGTYPFAPLYSSVNPIAPITMESDISNPTITHGKEI